MNDNSILNFPIDTNSKNLMKKNVQILLVLLIFSVLYSLFQLVDWGLFLRTSTGARMYSRHFFYYYRLSPLISIVEMALSIMAAVIVYMSFKNQSIAVDTEDAALFNKGIRFFNMALMIDLVYFLILFANIIFRLLIIKY
jgi:hypothetical protein